MKLPPLYKTNPQTRDSIPEVILILLLFFPLVPFLWGFSISAIGTIAITALLIGGIFGYLNRNLYRAHKNGHKRYTSIKVNVVAKNHTFYISTNYDEELTNVKDDVFQFLTEAGGVTPITSKIWQRDANSVPIFSEVNDDDATITVNIGFNPQDVNFDSLVQNLEKAVEEDDRIEELRSVELDTVKEDFREAVDHTQNNYRDYGKDVDVNDTVTQREKLPEITED